jgi:hypothetical protein
MDDPDAPMGTWIHWILWNVPPSDTKIMEGTIPVGSSVGLNSSGKNEYQGPCPPNGSHRYFFKLYALDIVLTLPENTNKKDLIKAMNGYIIEQAELMGIYQRK